jgi:site-specific recombinase XerC
VPHWHANQLRHNAATKVRKRYGIEAARQVLGHRSAAMTEIYAETDLARVAQIMKEIG